MGTTVAYCHCERLARFWRGEEQEEDDENDDAI
jgi:hypothetical protein